MVLSASEGFSKLYSRMMSGYDNGQYYRIVLFNLREFSISIGFHYLSGENLLFYIMSSLVHYEYN